MHRCRIERCDYSGIILFFNKYEDNRKLLTLKIAMSYQKMYTAGNEVIFPK